VSTWEELTAVVAAAPVVPAAATPVSASVVAVTAAAAPVAAVAPMTLPRVSLPVTCSTRRNPLPKMATFSTGNSLSERKSTASCALAYVG